MLVQHPIVPWISCNQIQAGVFICRCTVCGQSMAQPGATQAADEFADLHSAHESASGWGLGDIIAKLTGAVGLKPCTACERRRRQLNGLAPRVFRR